MSRPMTILMALTVLCAPVAAGTLDDLLGSWEWVSASGGFAGGVYGPDDWGYTSQLVFAADGSVVEYRDEQFHTQSVFELVGEGPGATLGAAPCDPPMMPFNDCGPYLLIFDDSGGETTMLLRTQLCADWYDFLYVARGPVAAEQRTWSGIKAVFR